MSNESPQLAGIYPTVPEAMVFAPDEESEFENAQTEFFQGIVQGLGYVSLNAVQAHCYIRSRELIRENDMAVEGNETNDRVTELQVLDRTVATTIKIRTGFNFIQGLFASYLTPQMEEEVRFRSL